MKNTLSLYGSHDCGAVFVDKNGEIKILEYERFVKKRYAMFSDRFDNRVGIGSNTEERVSFLEHIVNNTNFREITKIVYNELSTGDLSLIEKYFPNAFFEKKGHHFSHAIGGHIMSGFESSVIISADGGGVDDSTINFTKLYLGEGNKITPLGSVNINLGGPYSYIASAISEIKPGLDDNYFSLSYAGKIMGLCAYGNIRQDWLPAMRVFYKSTRAQSDSIKDLGNSIGLNLSYKSISGQAGYDLAATSQKVFEECMFTIVESVLSYNKNIILVGGCALNVLFNQFLYEFLQKNRPEIKLYVPPNPNDCGLALGQFLSEHPEASKQNLTYSGWKILDENKLDEYIKIRGAQKIEIAEIVNLLKDGKIIGLIEGCSEIGPRALGNRSIICDPAYKNMKDILNLKVKFREWYRPFAPVCRLQDKDTYFECAPEAVYMSYAPKVKKEYQDKLKSITHADGTSRLQTVTVQQHNTFYNILTELKNRNEIPVILNTSFNIRGKPILTTIEDALHVLDTTQLDYVVINRYLFKK